MIILCNLMTIANWIFFNFCNFWLKRLIKLFIVALFDIQIKTRKWLMRLIAFVIFKQNDITNFKTIVILSMIINSIINFTLLNKTCAYFTTFIEFVVMLLSRKNNMHKCSFVFFFHETIKKKFFSLTTFFFRTICEFWSFDIERFCRCLSCLR